MRSPQNRVEGRELLQTGLAFLLAIAPGLLLGSPTSAWAGDLKDAGTTVARLAEAGEWPATQVRPVLDQLEAETRRFLSGPRDAAAARRGGDLVRILAQLHTGLSSRLDAMREDVLERDGDLEALLATPAYREVETLALTALYHLSWARYRQSQLLLPTAPARQELLQDAVRGFTEFVYVNEIPEIYADCLYGRALAFHALGQTQKASEDLRAVLDLGKANPTSARAQAALDALRRGRPLDTPQPTDRTTQEIDRLRSLLRSSGTPATARASGTDTAARTKRAEAQAEALTIARALAARDRATAGRVDRCVRETGVGDAAFLNFLLAELANDRGDDSTARDHYAKALAAGDTDAARYRTRARLGIAVTDYRAGAYARAAEGFAGALAETPGSDEAEMALYFRFKAIEALRAGTSRATAPDSGADTSLATREAYVGALRAYLDRFPDSTNSAEVRYRLGETYHEDGDCRGATRVLGVSTGDGPWSVRARFIVLQCHANATSAAWRAASPDADAHYRATLETAREIIATVSTTNDAALHQLGAKASLVASLLAAAAPAPRPDDILEFVRDFETRFPHARDLAVEAVALRALTQARLGHLDEAQADIDRLLRSAEHGAARDRQLRHIGHEIIRAAERAEPAPRRALLTLGQQIYEALVVADSDGAGGREASDGDRAIVVTDLAILGQLAFEREDLDTAARTYDRLLAIDPNSLEALRGAARTAETQGRAEAALARWRRVTEQTTPGDRLWYESTLQTARMEELLGRPDRACLALRNAGAEAPLPPPGELETAYAEITQRVCR